MTTQILGVLNITRDSFSDGGRYLTPAAALRHARRLLAHGADIIDVGAEATHPAAERVSARTEIRRLTPVIRRLKAAGARVSVDTHKPAVMRHVLALGADLINDVTGLRDPEAVVAVRQSEARLIIMYSHAAGARAQRASPAALRARPGSIVGQIVSFFERRVSELVAAGIARRRLILDPGMGLFLSPDAAVSLAVLGGLERLAALGLPVCVSTSRKSFIGSLLGAAGRPRPVGQRGAGTLATELWAARHGAAYIRTHDVRALRDGLALLGAIESGAGC